MAIATGFDPRKRRRSIAYAAQTLAASDVNVDTTETITEFHIQLGYAVWKRSFR